MKKVIGIFLLAAIGSSVMAQETELIIQNGELVIAGTLNSPDESEAPLVLFLSGSGGQARDSDVFGFKVFKVMAAHFADQGIPSFRFDDRQLGKSTGNLSEATADDLVEDVNVIIEYFKNESETRFEKFILLGHSQGGMVAVKAAAQNQSVVQVVLMASPMFPLTEIINEQIVLMQTAMGKTEEEIASTLEFQEQVYEAVRSNEGWDSLKVAYKNLVEAEIRKLPEEQQAFIVDIEAFANAQYQQQVAPINSPHMKSFMLYDPAIDLVNLNRPVLAVFGEKDTQVTSDQNAPKFEQLCENGNVDCTLEIIPEANHLFQKAETGFANEYQTLPKEFIEGFLPLLSDWIHAQN